MNGTVNRWRERWRLLRHWGNRWHRESIAGQLLAVSVLLLLLMMTKQRTVETIVALSAAAVRIQANNTPTTTS